LEAIAISGSQPIYNVASGHLISHATLAESLAVITGGEVLFVPTAPKRIFPQVDINAAVAEFQYSPAMLLDQLEALISETNNK
jgi:hypothetical protein